MAAGVILMVLVLKPLPGPELRRDQDAFYAGGMPFWQLAHRTGAIGYTATTGPLAVRLPGETVLPDELLARFPDALADLDAVRRGLARCSSYITLRYHRLCVTWRNGTRIGGTASKGGYVDQPALQGVRFETEYIADDYHDDAVQIQYWSSDEELLDRFDTRSRPMVAEGYALPGLTDHDKSAALEPSTRFFDRQYNISGFAFDTPFARLSEAVNEAYRHVRPPTSALDDLAAMAPVVGVYAYPETWGDPELDPRDKPLEVLLYPLEAARGPTVRPSAVRDLDERWTSARTPVRGLIAQFRTGDFRHGDQLAFIYASGRTKRRTIDLTGVR